jgi:hypothetical protein
MSRPGGSFAMGDKLSDQRAANAHAASHGYGAARRLAAGLAAEWAADEDGARAAALLEEPERAQAHAESMEVPFEDYLTELDARASENGGALPTDQRDRLRDFYVAGFDIGFRSALIAACEKLAPARISPEAV